MRPPTLTGPLFGRERETAAITAFLDGSSAARALVIDGEPGIGKSTLWGTGLVGALDRHDTLLSARATQAEASMSFAGLGDLLAPVGDRLTALPARQLAALDVALLRRTPGAVPPTEREIGVALLEALRLLANVTVVMLAIDDLQWLDRASAEVLGYALRRIQTEPIRILLTYRTSSADDTSDSAPSAVTMLAAVTGLSPEFIHVGPLPDGTVTELINSRLAAPPPASIGRQLAAAAGGNPFWAIELAEASSPEYTRAGSGEIRVPASLDGLLTARLARFTDGARIALVMVTALSRPTWAAVARALSPLVSEPDAAIDDAVAHGALTESSGRLAPTHPLLGAAALRALSPTRRRSLHRRLAEMSSDPEQRGRHLALASTGEPDAEIASSLDAGVRSARSRGASHAAAELAALAVGLTPPSDHAELTRRTAGCRRVVLRCRRSRPRLHPSPGRLRLRPTAGRVAPAVAASGRGHLLGARPGGRPGGDSFRVERGGRRTAAAGDRAGLRGGCRRRNRA